MPNVITRRSFLSTSSRATLAAALASFANVPLFVRRALAEGTIGLNNKKVIFIFLRGGNDGINNVIPINDPAYATARPGIGLQKDPDPGVLPLYDQSSGSALSVGAGYGYAIPLGNGFSALHPALYNLVSPFNDGDVALIHRVAYPRQSRSHFDSERYWENGVPYANSLREGIFYRTMMESGLAGSRALLAVSVQSNMPLMIRGGFPMTNLSSVNRYNVVGVYGTDRSKHTNQIAQVSNTLYPIKDNRTLIYGLNKQFTETLNIFTDPVFGDNTYVDGASQTLFPTNDQFYSRIKTAAQILNHTEAIVTGTELGGFDTHTNQGGATGSHANLLRRVGWTIYALQQYFKRYGKGGPAEVAGAKASWDDVVVVTLSEFGRTTIENDSTGTDHAEASVMYVAGGAVRGGIYCCDPGMNAVMGVPNWTPGPQTEGGSMFGASQRYLKRAVDFRSVVGEIIRDHLGATQAQLNRIIPAYEAEEIEHLRLGVAAGEEVSTPITGELGII
jgi:uncharacterized protein (DUF1501 family)